MSHYTEIAQLLQDSLKLAVPPVAVCISDEAPPGVPRPSGPRAAGCVFWEESMKGPIVTAAPEHELCSIGVYTHQMVGASTSYESELGDVLKVMADLSYVRPEDIPSIPVLARKARFITYSPLAQSPLPPDAVLLFAQSRQGLVISEAAQQVDAEIPPALGRPACAVVPQVVNSGRAALSLGCCGARAYLNVFSDDTALWALPGPKLAQYAERIAALTKANETLTSFHVQRQKDIASGLMPTYRESLTRF